MLVQVTVYLLEGWFVVYPAKWIQQTIFLGQNDVVNYPLVQVKMGDAGSLVCMLKNCRPEVVACMQDEQCKAALDALTACGLNDQVPHLLILFSL